MLFGEIPIELATGRLKVNDTVSKLTAPGSELLWPMLLETNPWTRSRIIIEIKGFKIQQPNHFLFLEDLAVGSVFFCEAPVISFMPYVHTG